MSKDDLEEFELLEVCTNCGSLNLQEYESSTSKRIVCGNCGTVDFTHTITETEYIINQQDGKNRRD
jgi:ribosomal protein S27AE